MIYVVLIGVLIFILSGNNGKTDAKPSGTVTSNDSTDTEGNISSCSATYQGNQGKNNDTITKDDISILETVKDDSVAATLGKNIALLEQNIDKINDQAQTVSPTVLDATNFSGISIPSVAQVTQSGNEPANGQPVTISGPVSIFSGGPAAKEIFADENYYPYKPGTVNMET